MNESDLRNWNYATQALCIIFMATFFFVRVYTRTFIQQGFGKEDCTCLSV